MRCLVAVAVLALVCTFAARPAAGDTASDLAAAKAQLDQLQKQADELQRSYSQTVATVDTLKAQITDLEGRLGDLQGYVAQEKQRILQYAITTYKHGPAAMDNAIILTGSRNLNEFVRASHYLSDVQRGNIDTFERFDSDSIAVDMTSKRLQDEKAAEDRLVGDLHQQQDAIEAAVAKAQQLVDQYKSQPSRLALPPNSLGATVSGGHGSLQIPPDLQAYQNGMLPDTVLQLIGVGAHMLWPLAAQKYVEMVTAATADGVTIGITDSYRPYAVQVQLAQEKGLYSQGGLAATPGRSNHGWGLAVDLDLNDIALQWMRSHANVYGWYEEVPRETWHWQFHYTQFQ